VVHSYNIINVSPDHIQSHTHTHTHTQSAGLPGQEIGPTQTPIPDTQHSQQVSMPPVRFKPAIPASKRLHTP